MVRWLYAGAAAFVACGCSSSAGAGDGHPTTAAEGGVDAPVTIDAGPPVTFDADPQTDPDVAYTVTLRMDPFVVGSGQEIYMCQSYANPFKGQQVDITTYELEMTTGSHHMFLFNLANAPDEAAQACPQGGLSFSPFTFSGQSANVTQTYPPGVGATIPTSVGFYMNVHYINTGAAPIQGHVQVTLHVAKPGVVTQHAGVIFLNDTSISVPPTNQPYVATQMYTLPQDVNILSSSSHMHKRATDFTATTSTGVTLFHTTQWAEPPPQVYSPPLMLPSGTTITWSCTYVNDTTAPLTFGESAATNVMCIGVSPFYPVADINNPVLGSLL
jgi:hypothetical protein